MRVQRILNWFKSYHRTTDFISAAMLYLKNNFLLERPLKSEDIKDRILGHWGTVPGINFIYGGLNYIVSKEERDIMLFTGPGHGAPAILANLFLEGTLEKFYPEKYSLNLEGMKRLIKDFSAVNGFPSHTSPIVPGTILEGGELGYSLATAFGAVMDNPNLIAACIIGDGEAETATLSASWQSNKFINPILDGTVLPILHLNGYRISGPTIFSSMTDLEIENYFSGLGYRTIFVNQYTSDDIYIDYLEALLKAFSEIDSVKKEWLIDNQKLPIWPIIVLKTKKGWGCPAMLGDKKLEDSNFSHGIPLLNPKTNNNELMLLSKWLGSYNISEFILPTGEFVEDIFDFVPMHKFPIGINTKAYGFSKELKLPDLADHELRHISKGSRNESRMENLAEYLRDIISLNKENSNFRIFSPDESESNQLDPVLEATGVRYVWPVREADKAISLNGRIMELLSENVLQGWMQGYVLTGRYGVLISYESFFNIISSQIDQYIKFLKGWRAAGFRKPIPSANFIATSTLWRQEHNGFTHQNPTLINSLLTKYDKDVRLFFPIDVNSLIVTMDTVLKTKNGVNLIISCKRDLPQWLSLEESKEHILNGFSEFLWANLSSNSNSDLLFISIGDYQNVESLAAVSILKNLLPEVAIRFINIHELSQLGFGTTVGRAKIDAILKNSSSTIINFHGYPTAINQILFNIGIEQARVKVLGYIEEGSTTTPFDMQVRNKTSRYHVVLESIEFLLKKEKITLQQYEKVKDFCINILKTHANYINENNIDLPEVRNWKWE